jgi:uncharacterized protein (UPF0332 family)
MNEEIKALARYRIEKAEEAFKEGELLLEKCALSGAVNRFYYSAFYAARALLATKGVDSSKHKGVISLFDEHFVKTGLLDREISKTLSRSFQKRLKTDYADFVAISQTEVENLKRDVICFISECKRVLML